ncbi:hypothetical protein FQN60_007529 [Etheostoma spectabile]|uniref:4-galactosyl-N-acetylglucosaminide 3-alpha-L-fucosyltransferase 9 n=1 Tax=Etheostoma spectabile TaxID=54343 RepID=A0A5J5CZC8_9PERO|nr:hypothetical protein FQN60_007529 [Etheostoma spectabile]
MASISSYLRPALTVIIVLAGLTVLFLMYYNSFPSPKCHPPPSHLQKPHTDKPVVLLWFWPENKMFDFQDCKTFFDIDSCHLTDDRSLYSEAHGVLLFHRAIQDDLSNLPTSPRKKFQRWIWFNTDSPSNTRRIEGIKSIFNLTMSYRKDADIHIRWRLTLRKKTDADFVLPKKERLLCWIVDSLDLNTAGEGYKYYKQLLKHIKNHEFAYAICQACYYIGLGMNSKFRFVPDLYKWFLLL